MCRGIMFLGMMLFFGGINGQSTKTSIVFEFTFEHALSAESKAVVLSDFAALTHVKDVCSTTANTFRLAVEKGFVVEQVKPTVEKLHLSIESYTEDFYSYKNLCSEKDKLKD